MSNAIAVEDSTFEQMVLKSDKPVMVDFWATWCKPCTAIAPIIDELANEYGDKVSFVKMDVDNNKKTPGNYGIMSIPTLIIFKGGQLHSHMVGLRPKAELKKNLDAALA